MINKIIKFFTKDITYIVIIWTILLIELFYSSFVVQNYQHTFTSLIGLIIIVTPWVLRNKYDIKLPRLLSAFIIIFTFASLFLGEIHGFYEYFWWWDIFLHTSSSMVFGFIGLAILQMIFKAQKINAKYGMISLFAFTFSFAIGALWEIVEFSIDIIFGYHMQLDSLQDTMGDLLADMFGSLIVVLLAYLHWKYGQKNFVGRYIDKIMNKY